MHNRFDLTKKIAAAAAAAVMACSSASVAMPVIFAAGGTGSSQSVTSPSLSMSLLAGGSEIGILFYVSVPGSLSDYTFTLDDAPATVTQSESGDYIEAAENAMDMLKKHTVVIKKGSDEVLKKSVSVCDYLNEIVSGGSDMDDVKPLAKSMLMYGGAAQEYFGVDAKGSPSDGITGADYSSVTISADAVAKDDLNSALSGSPVSYYGMNLSLKSKLRLTLYFELAEGSSMTDAKSFLSDFTFGGSSADVQANGTKYLQIGIDVPASKLDESYELTNGSISAKFSAAQYLAMALEDSDSKLVDVCKALYAYGTEAKNAPSPSSDEKWMSDVTHSGYATWYPPDYDGPEGGAALLDDYAKEYGYENCALSVADYNGAELAGAYLELTNESGKTAYVLVTNVDGANNMESGDVDILITRFTQDESFVSGKIPIEWHILPLPSADTENISYKIKNGSSKSWCEIQVRNHRYPITKLEYKTSSGDFEELTRMSDYNYFHFPEGAVTSGKATLRITDIYGESIVEEDIDLKLPESAGDAYTVAGTVQFTK
ncbi:MAG: hypothetical protein IJ071_04410 [Ruminococcus sp.]|nr:hypothetical protein [Ruminococcus sp.]